LPRSHLPPAAEFAVEFAAEVQAHLLAYENAIVALIVALDKTGVLPIAAAKEAIDAVAGELIDSPPNEPQRQVFRRLSERLRRETPRAPSGRHRPAAKKPIG
jgi:hypothetical protein